MHVADVENISNFYIILKLCLCTPNLNHLSRLHSIELSASFPAGMLLIAMKQDAEFLFLLPLDGLMQFKQSNHGRFYMEDSVCKWTLRFFILIHL